MRALLDVKVKGSKAKYNRKSVSEMELDVDIALDQMLQQAVKDEDYELAATVRDAIAQRKIKSKEHIHVK